MEIAIIADEISPDPNAAVHIGAAEWGLGAFELRFMMNERVPDVPEPYVRDLLNLKERYGIRYTALAAGLFKCGAEQEQLEHQLGHRLEKAIALAKRLDIGTVTGFALHDLRVHRPAELRETAVPYLRAAVRRSTDEGLVFAVETEYMTGCETAADVTELRERVGPELKANWDPANAWIAGEDPLDGYALLRGHIANIHCKDADTREWWLRNPFVPLGEGGVPWAKLIPLLERDGGIRALTIETHSTPQIPQSMKSLRQLRQWLEAAHKGA